MRLPTTPSLPTAPATEASARFGAPTGGSASGSRARFEDHFNDAVDVATQDAPRAAVDSAAADADSVNSDSSNSATARPAETADPLAQPQGGELPAAVRPQILAASMSTFWATLVPADGGESAASGASGGEVQTLLEVKRGGGDIAGAGQFDSASLQTDSLTDSLTIEAGAPGSSTPGGSLATSTLAAPGTAIAHGPNLPASVAAASAQGSAVNATLATFSDAATARALLSPSTAAPATAGTLTAAPITAGTQTAAPSPTAQALQASIAGVTGAGVGQTGENSSAGDGSAPEQQPPAPSALQGTGRAEGIPALAVPATATSPVAGGSPLPAPLPATTTPLLAQLTRPLFTLATAPLGDHVMTIAVVPDSLGPVTVRAHLAADRIHIELMSASDAGREGLRTILGELRRDLAAAGMPSSLSLGSGNGSSGQGSSAHGSPGQSEPGYGGLDNGAGQRGQQGPGNQAGAAVPAGHRGNRDGESPSDPENLSASNTSLDITV